MPTPQELESLYTSSLGNCSKNWDTVFDTTGVVSLGGALYLNTDGTISAFFNTNTEPQPFFITETCCKVLADRTGEDYYYDLEEQKCRWQSIESGCDPLNTPIKVTLNPVGNDGALFQINGDEGCSLTVQFDYLFKFSCTELQSVIGASQNVNKSETVKNLENSISDAAALVEETSYKISELGKQYLNLKYSIFCNEFPTNDVKDSSEKVTPLTDGQKSVFSKTGFGGLSDLISLDNSLTVKPTYSTKPVNFCITDDGLPIWKKILGDNDYQRFINGDATSYTCDNVIAIYNLNEKAIIENNARLIYECDTPFGEKTKVFNDISELNEVHARQFIRFSELESDLSTATTISSTACDTLVGQFEALSANLTIDVINPDSSVSTVYQTNLFQQIGQGNLYNYLSLHPTNSGFYICGQPNVDETFATGCTALYYPEFTQTPITQTEVDSEVNVSECNILKPALMNELFLQSGYADDNLSSFYSSLSPTIFSSNWLSYSGTITDVGVIEQITNKKIKLSVVINSSCGNYCLLVDKITLQKECVDTNRTNIFISQSPGFELTKIVDNKKSWVEVTEPDDREFEIRNVKSFNPIRQTDYSLDEERLIINSKEIDLNMNMAKAVENDVWCFIADYPNVLTGQTCDVDSPFMPTDYFGNPIVLPTAQTATSAESIITFAYKFIINCLRRYGSEDPQARVCYPEIECQLCGKILKITLDRGDYNLWVTCQSNGDLGFYFIDDVTDVQNNIFNVTNQFLISGTTMLNEFNDYVNLNMSITNPEMAPFDAFWNTTNGKCNSCCVSCGDQSISFTGFLTTNITEINTLESFQDYLTSELIDVKNRKILSAYPTLRATYDRYLNSTLYGVPISNQFDYYKMDKFVGLIHSYWDDLIEQVVPATTLWGSVKVYTNTIFDEQKFKYKSYTSMLCNNPLNQILVPSPINGISGQCQDVEVITTNIQVFDSMSATTNTTPQTFDRLCISQMNWGSEFVGNVDIMDASGNYLNSDDFCNPPCNKKVTWYSMQESPEYMMEAIECSGVTFGVTGVTLIVNSFVVNGTEYVVTPYSSDTLTANNNINWVPANNSIVSGCTSGTTGWTYTNFVDLLNQVFTDSGLDYEARVSLTERTVPNSASKNGFYIIYPQNDLFFLDTTSDNQVLQFDITYANGALSFPSFPYNYTYTNDVNYNCVTNTIIE